jgi:hypothetical protein
MNMEYYFISSDKYIIFYMYILNQCYLFAYDIYIAAVKLERNVQLCINNNVMSYILINAYQII